MRFRTFIWTARSRSHKACSRSQSEHRQRCVKTTTQTPARLANSPGFKSFRCPRERIKFSLERFSDQSRLRAQPLESSLGRVPQAADGTCKKFRKPDRVGRRGLSEPREDFSRLPTYAFPRLCPMINSRSSLLTNQIRIVVRDKHNNHRLTHRSSMCIKRRLLGICIHRRLHNQLCSSF